MVMKQNAATYRANRATGLWAVTICLVCFGLWGCDPTSPPASEPEPAAKAAAAKPEAAENVVAVARAFPASYYAGGHELQTTYAAMEGKPAPKVKLVEWMNGEVTEADREGKIVVIDIWATWCAPCITQIPHNNAIASKYADRGVLVIGICSSRSGQEKMAMVAETYGIDYPIAKDIDAEAVAAWSVVLWPTYAVIDRSGNVAALGLMPDAIEKVIDSLLEAEAAAE